VTPAASTAQALFTTAERASASVGPSTVRHACWPLKVMQTSQR
jgi:hypothetical protein